MDPKYEEPRPAEMTAQAIAASTRVKQMEHEEAYQKATVDVMNQLRDVEGDDMSKSMKVQIQQWFTECR